MNVGNILARVLGIMAFLGLAGTKDCTLRGVKWNGRVYDVFLKITRTS